MSDANKPATPSDVLPPGTARFATISMRLTEALALTYGYTDSACYSISLAANALAQSADALGDKLLADDLAHCAEVLLAAGSAVQSIRNQMREAWEALNAKSSPQAKPEEPKPAESRPEAVFNDIEKKLYNN